MKAILVENGRLVLGDAPEPEVGVGQVKIAVAASAVNRADLVQAAGGYPPPPGASPILGLECAGEVVEVGEGRAAGQARRSSLRPAGRRRLRGNGGGARRPSAARAPRSFPARSRGGAGGVRHSLPQPLPRGRPGHQRTGAAACGRQRRRHRRHPALPREPQPPLSSPSAATPSSSAASNSAPAAAPTATKAASPIRLLNGPMVKAST